MPTRPLIDDTCTIEPPPAADHVREDRLGEAHGCDQVQGQRLEHRVDRLVLGRADLGGRAGRVDEDPGSTQAVDDVTDQPGHLREVEQVARDRDAADLLRERGQPLLTGAPPRRPGRRRRRGPAPPPPPAPTTRRSRARPARRGRSARGVRQRGSVVLSWRRGGRPGRAPRTRWGSACRPSVTSRRWRDTPCTRVPADDVAGKPGHLLVIESVACDWSNHGTFLVGQVPARYRFGNPSWP